MAKKDNKALSLMKELHGLLDDEDHLSRMNRTDRRTILQRAPELARRLHELEQELDPVTWGEVFDPTDPKAMAGLLAERLEKSDKVPLEEVRRFWGAGVYAVYYSGRHRAYANCVAADVPVYVGKADPADDRALNARKQGDRLYSRLRDHRRSIKAVDHFSATEPLPDGAEPLLLVDFACRFLVLTSAFAAAVERNLIQHYGPVWNGVCPGFGKHGDSPKTRSNTRSEWDTLHLGRSWATTAGNKPNPRTPTMIVESIIAHSVRYRT